jgi:PKD repeat protein
MPKLSSSLRSTSTAVARNIDDSEYDNIVGIVPFLNDIAITATNIGSVNTVAGNIVAIVNAQNAYDTVTNLTASATSIYYYLSASAELIGSDIHIEVPQGVPGTGGLNGSTPVLEFTYNETTGDLEYTVVSYIDGDQEPITEVL